MSIRARSRAVRWEETRRVYRLLGELRELRDTPQQQAEHCILGLRELLGGCHGFLTVARGFRRGGEFGTEGVRARGDG